MVSQASVLPAPAPPGDHQEQVVHEGLVVVSGVETRDDAHGRRKNRPALRQADAVLNFRERALHGVRHPVGEVGGGDGHRGGVLAPARDGAISNQHVHAAEAARVRGHDVINAVEHAYHSTRARAGLAQVQAAGHGVGVVPQVHLDGGLFAVDSNMRGDGDALFRRAGHGVVRAVGGGLPCGEFFDGGDHELLAVVEPLLREVVQRLPAVFIPHGEHLALADSRSAYHGEVIAVPLLGHADAHPAEIDEILVVLEVFLHLGGREDERALLIHVARVAHVGGGLAASAVRLMGLHPHGELVNALRVDDGREDGVIRRVRTAVVGRVVEIGVATFQVRV